MAAPKGRRVLHRREPRCGPACRVVWGLGLETPGYPILQPRRHNIWAQAMCVKYGVGRNEIHGNLGSEARFVLLRAIINRKRPLDIWLSRPNDCD